MTDQPPILYFIVQEQLEELESFSKALHDSHWVTMTLDPDLVKGALVLEAFTARVRAKQRVEILHSERIPDQ